MSVCAKQAAFAVKLKIDNLNLEDIFDLHRLKNLMSLFKDRLWTESDQDLHLVRNLGSDVQLKLCSSGIYLYMCQTFVASALDVGYRRPLMPSPKDGVVLHLGSSANFSSDLLDLDRETSPLRKFEPACPRDFKRTSVERHFRAKGFGMDWCEFRLLTLREDGVYRYGFVLPIVASLLTTQFLWLCHSTGNLVRRIRPLLRHPRKSTSSAKASAATSPA